MTNLNNVEPWLAQAKPVAAQFPTSLGLTSYNLFLVNHRMKIIHQSAQHANTIMRTSKQQMKPLLPSTNWIQNWMTDIAATVCMKRRDMRIMEEDRRRRRTHNDDPVLRVYLVWRSLTSKTPDRVSTRNGIWLSNNRMSRSFLCLDGPLKITSIGPYHVILSDLSMNISPKYNVKLA